MTKTHTTRDGLVYRAAELIGSVEKIEWPTQKDGIVTVETRWEARRAHEMLMNNPFGFPTFATRRSAVEHLTNEGQK